MRALVSRSMKKKFRKAFPEWNTCNIYNSIEPVGQIWLAYGRSDCFYWLESEIFTDKQKQFFQDNNIRVVEEI